MTASNTPIERDPRLLLQEEGVSGLLRSGLDRLRSGELGSLPVIVGLIVIWAYFQTSTNGTFLNPGNLVDLSVQISYGGIITLGIVLVLLLGEIDLSVGSMSGLCAGIVAVLNVKHGWNPVVAIVFAMAVGAALGAVQGFFFSRFNVPSFVVTLAGLLAFFGLQLQVLGATGTLNFPFGGAISDLTNMHYGPAVSYPLVTVMVAAYVLAMVSTRVQQQRAGLTPRPWSLIIGRAAIVAVVLYVGVWELNRDRGLPLAFVIFVAACVLFALVTTRTTYGRHIFAVGGNVEAARRAGINVRFIQITVFAISGGMAAFGGVMSASFVLSASQSTGGSSLLLYVIAAAVIGGTSLFGGRGSAWSALLGWLVIGSIYNGMFLKGYQSAVQNMVIGGVLLGAAIIDALSRRGRQSHGKA